MNAVELIQECTSLNISVKPEPDGSLFVDPIAKLTDELRNGLVANKPEIIEYLTNRQRLHIHRVLVRLRDIKPFRSGDSLQWRGNPSQEQQQLLHQYRSELIETLTPRALTNHEAEQLALWLNDIGEVDMQERTYVFSQANSSPADRVALLWMAEGSPD